MADPYTPTRPSARQHIVDDEPSLCWCAPVPLVLDLEDWPQTCVVYVHRDETMERVDAFWQAVRQAMKEAVTDALAEALASGRLVEGPVVYREGKAGMVTAERDRGPENEPDAEKIGGKDQPRTAEQGPDPEDLEKAREYAESAPPPDQGQPEEGSAYTGGDIQPNVTGTPGQGTPAPRDVTYGDSGQVRSGTGQPGQGA